MTVIDASVVVAALTDSSPLGRWAERAVTDSPLYAPHIMPAETLNILRRLERAQRISNYEASTAARHLHTLAVELLPLEPFFERIWAMRENLTCYDAWYVAIAEAAASPLATLDRRVARAPGPKCEFRLPRSDDR